MRQGPWCALTDHVIAYMTIAVRLESSIVPFSVFKANRMAAGKPRSSLDIFTGIRANPEPLVPSK